MQNLIHAAGIQSPGLASAPAIAEEISRITVDALQEQMEVKPNTGFNPRRRVIPHMSDLTTEEKQEIIRKNPDYGVIICRCEGISKGEIVDTIHSPIPATTIDALKRACAPAWAGARAASVPRWSRRSSARRRGFPQRRSPKAGRILT